MKRIIWYAAAACIFISSALAKPSHGAMLGDFVPLEKGGGTEMDAFCKNFGDLREWLAGFPASSGGTYISDETPDQGAEWFPGQGPSVWGDCGPGAGDCFPGGGGSSQAGNGQSAGDSAGNSSQNGNDLTGNSQMGSGSTGNHPTGNSQGAEWFPGQGPAVWGNCGPDKGDCFPGVGGSSQAGNGQSAGDSAGESSENGNDLTENSQMGNGSTGNHPTENDQGAEWFPGQGPAVWGGCGPDKGNSCPGGGGNGQSAGGNAGDSSQNGNDLTGNSQAGSGSTGNHPTGNGQGAEWFPGQGPAVWGDCDPGLGDLFPGGGGNNQDAENGQGGWLPWFPDISEFPDLDFPWFPGQGGNGQGSDQDDPQNGPQTWFPGGQDHNQGGSGGQNDYPGSGQGGTQGSASYVTRIIELVNQERAAAGLSPVTESAQLTAAANIRAREIVSNFSHNRPDGTYFNTVLFQNNISYRKAGENIAYGYDTPERVMAEWMNSPSHRANILTDVFTSIGIGYYQDGNGVKYWTQLFTY